MAGTPTFGIVAALFQIILLVLYIIFAEYSDDLGKGSEIDTLCHRYTTEAACTNSTSSSGASCAWNGNVDECESVSEGVSNLYPFFQDVHAMIFIGFGFLMTFLSRYGFTAVGLNFFLAALTIQWSNLTNEFWHRVFENKFDHKILMDIEDLVTGDFAAGAVLITFGAVLGKVTPLQMVFVVFFEMIFYSLNESIGVVEFEAVDMGGSMFVHMFGAYFGIGVAYILNRRAHKKGERIGEHKNNTSTAVSDLFATLGTLVLWIFWPSFNGALATGAGQHRVVINTVFALSAGCVSAFIASNLLRPGYKFSMVDVQNATLAGAVAVGSSADLVIQPWGAILIGMVGGTLSVVGYIYITPFLERTFGFHDTCGVNNLHGMPGFLGAISGAVSAAMADDVEYGQPIGEVFPARSGDDPRSAGEQGGFQAATMFMTFGISLVGGLITGAIISKLPGPKTPFSDEEFWDHEEEHEPLNGAAHGKDDVILKSPEQLLTSSV